jgi:HEPN domain-containing protein
VFSPSPEQIEYAVEKSMKVALVLADADLPLSHDLKFLVRQVRETGAEPAQDIADTAWLTPWAAELRYDEPISLDRTAALAAAESATTWAASLLADAKRPQPDPGRNLGRKLRRRPSPESPGFP